MVFLRKIQQIPGTDPRYPEIQIWQDFLHQQVVEGLGYVPGVCWSFLRVFLLIPLNDRKISRGFPEIKKNLPFFFFRGLFHPNWSAGGARNFSRRRTSPVWPRHCQFLVGSLDGDVLDGCLLICALGGWRDRTVKFGNEVPKNKNGEVVKPTSPFYSWTHPSDWYDLPIHFFKQKCARSPKTKGWALQNLPQIWRGCLAAREFPKDLRHEKWRFQMWGLEAEEYPTPPLG